jgi:hypothetical protein
MLLKKANFQRVDNPLQSIFRLIEEDWTFFGGENEVTISCCGRLHFFSRCCR